MWAALALVLVVAAGCALALARDRSERFRASTRPAGSVYRSSSNRPSIQTPVPATHAGARAALPAHVAVPRIGISSSLQRLHLLANGELQSPSAWMEAGWYADGTRPGDVGPAVIAGHVDSTLGPAVFYRLREMRVGDKILVTEVGGKVLTFVVSEVRSYPKDEFPTDTVYGPTALPELRLVTCTGEFDYIHHNYLDNLVVFAVLAGVRAG
jgi:LPXTG-site transpeptidase (sortase) family protein